jgi:hypothetical protein
VKRDGVKRKRTKGFRDATSQGFLLTSTLPEHLMASLAHGTSGLGILKSGLCGPVSRVSGMTTRAPSGAGGGGLPARQLLVPMIGPGLLLFLASPAFTDNRHRLFGQISSLDHSLVAF